LNKGVVLGKIDGDISKLNLTKSSLFIVLKLLMGSRRSIIRPKKQKIGL